MADFFIYSLEAGTGIALFYLLYWLLLRNETFFVLNRIYLLSALVLSLLLPALNIPVSGADSVFSKYLAQPVAHYEQQFLGRTINPNKAKIKGSVGSEQYADAILPAGETTAQVSLPLLPKDTIVSSTKASGWLEIAAIIYCCGLIFCLLRLLVSTVWLLILALGHKKQRVQGLRVLRLPGKISPFSFWQLIFISESETREAELQKIVAHEKVHIRQRHAIDLLLTELLIALQWFNPFAWLYKRAVKINHEYLADQGTLKAGVDLSAYQYSLLGQSLRANHFGTISNYNLSIKKRIAMMMKKRSTRLSVLKLSLALPLVVLLFSAFAFSSTAVQQSAINQNNRLDDDTTIKRVDVPASYLQLLEGEYLSNEKGADFRRISMTVVMGELVGNDRGYIYRLIPVGGEKFVNPDDHVVLSFNSSNKSAITLSLLGLQLTRVPALSQSVAFALANQLSKDKNTDVQENFKKYKESGNYYLYENELNYAGYMLLQAGKAKEAAALFRLNVGQFPNSFNVYDSYGEALLALGEKAQAIENYKKSLQLNPGNANARKILQEAGMNTDTLVKKVSLDYLHLLEGQYLSSNPDEGIRKVKIKVIDGTLTGEDNGYKYKLQPAGGGKFINPDDGASLVFNTDDKNAITLQMFGWQNLKKVSNSLTKEIVANPPIKKVEVSVDYLRLLAGEYLSTNGGRQRKIIFTEMNGSLVGNDAGYVYTIIPVGGEKFINPDDHASLVFNSKDKSAISLLLFGRVTLKKVK